MLVLLIHLPVCVLVTLGCASFAAQGQDAGALAEQLAHPIAGRAGVPMQFSHESGIGSFDDGDRYFNAPDSGAECGLGFTFTLLFPRK